MVSALAVKCLPGSSWSPLTVQSQQNELGMMIHLTSRQPRRSVSGGELKVPGFKARPVRKLAAGRPLWGEDVTNEDEIEIRGSRGGANGLDQRDSQQFLRLSKGWADPTPENVVALVLTGLLVFALLRICWQLLTAAILVSLAALRYSFVAALLVAAIIFIL